MLAEDLRGVYRAETEEEAQRALRRLRERWGHIVVEKLLYLVLSGLNERLEGRRLGDFAEVRMESYHEAQTH